jgi:hypothetical protein
LLHLVHPYALLNLHGVLNHIQQFRIYLGTLTASEVNAQIARDTLVDLVDCSGINLDLLQPLLLHLMEDAKALEGSVLFNLTSPCLTASFGSSERLSKSSGILHAYTGNGILIRNSRSKAGQLSRNRQASSLYQACRFSRWDFSTFRFQSVG